MNKRKWRVMVTLEYETNASKKELEQFVVYQLKKDADLEVAGIEAVEVSQ